ncbi:MAG: hypothetical protein JJU00_18475 [Opitutales bacterium]|nr:hypothetical protein [Opitutales bacterium]
MKKLLLVMLGCILSLPFSTNAEEMERKNFAEIRESLLDKEVLIVGGTTLDFHGQNRLVLLSWWEVQETDTGFERRRVMGSSVHASADYRGEFGKVVAVSLRHEREMDAFGDPIPDTAFLDPSFDVFVRMGDGSIITAGGYYWSIQAFSFVLRREVDRIRDIVMHAVDELQGKEVYTVATSRIYSISASVADLTGLSRLSRERKRIKLPNLTTVVIENSRILEKEFSVITRIRTLDDELGILYLDLRTKVNREPDSDQLIDQLGHGLLQKIPDNLSEREIEAIKSESIFRGMSKDALTYSWGRPDEENDWRAGGKQLIYGRTNVYIQDGVITDWQRL